MRETMDWLLEVVERGAGEVHGLTRAEIRGAQVFQGSSVLTDRRTYRAQYHYFS